MVTWNAKEGDLVVLPEYRSDPGLVVLNKTYNDLERPILVKYLDGTIIEPRFFDKPLASLLFKQCHGFIDER